VHQDSLTILLEIGDVFDWHTVDNGAGSHVAPIFLNQFAVGFLGGVYTGDGVVFVGALFLEVLWVFISSPDPAATDFEVWFHTVDAMDSEGVFAEGLDFLEETFRKVDGQEALNTFTFGLLVFHEPDGVAGVVEFFPEEFHSVMLVSGVDEEGLEVVEVEG